MAKQTFTTGQVLTAAQMTSLQQTAMLGGAASAKTASYTLVAADAGTAISMSNAGATTITVNTGLFAAGDTVQITNLGAGVCTITAGTATVNSSASLALAQYESGTLDFTSASAAVFIKGAGGGASGSITLLTTTSLSGSETLITGIDQTYKDLRIYIYGVTNATANGVFFANPRNSTTNLTVVAAAFSGDPGSAGSIGNSQGPRLSTDAATLTLDRTNSANFWALTIKNYASTTTPKTYEVAGGFYEASDARQEGWFVIGQVADNSAVNAMRFANSGGNLSTGTVQIYGVN